MGSPIRTGEFPTATVEQLLIGSSHDSFCTTPVSELEIDHEGIVDEPRTKRRGLLMPADVRTRGVRKGTLVPHQQHLSVIDTGSLDAIAQGLEIDDEVTARNFDMSAKSFIASCIGINIVLSMSEEQDLYRVPNGSIVGVVDESGYMEPAIQFSRYNAPCITPGKELASRYPGAHDNMASEFVRIAERCRGVVAAVYVAGLFRESDVVSLVPKQTIDD